MGYFPAAWSALAVGMAMAATPQSVEYYMGFSGAGPRMRIERYAARDKNGSPATLELIYLDSTGELRECSMRRGTEPPRNCDAEEKAKLPAPHKGPLPGDSKVDY